MIQEQDGWTEYRRMIVDWHEDDLRAHERIDKSLTEINKTLIEIRTERKISGWVAGIVLPGFVALMVTAAAHVLKW
jgi:hypothetical protein